ncbi:MAG: class I SAM-dependent methyltransferase [Candidatus Aminicenantes bacterium]|nr:class I SAM-dependent methyltransferase [Candidatus Aminicenantes bacterium]
MSIKNVVKSITPKPIRNTLKDLIGITALNERISELQKQIAILEDMLLGENIWERSRKRWRESEPEKGLTWGKEISGDNFIKKLKPYVNFNEEKKILDIGPGYGRLLKSCLGMKIPFKKYVGLDLSQKNVDFLKVTFPGESMEFIKGDVEKVGFNDRFDIVYSSLTFKHLFPSFKNSLKNLSEFMKPGAIIAFDLVEGNSRVFEEDHVTYLRSYTKEEVTGILYKIPFEFVSFDQVEHDPGFIRLLVVAKKL